MKLFIAQNKLNSALANAAKGINKKSSIPIVQNFLFDATDATEALKIVTTDLTKTVVQKLPAQVTEPGSAVLPPKIRDIISKAPSDSTIAIEVVEGKAKIQFGSAKFTLQVFDADDYPGLPSVQLTTEISSDALKQLSAVSIAAEMNGKRPIYGCIRFDSGAVATDTLRIAWFASDINLPLLLEAQSVKHLADMLPPGIVAKWGSDDTNARFSWDAGEFYIRAVAGSFPDWRRVIPREYNIIAKFNNAELVSAVERAALINRFVTLDIGLESVTVQAAGDDGALSEMVAAESDGDLQINYNAGYLLDGLRYTGAGELRLNRAADPGILENGERGYLVLPVWLKQ